MLSQAIIAAFLATSAVALEVKPACSDRVHDRWRTAATQAGTAPAQEIVAASDGNVGVCGNDRIA
jgi:hypothetical protein